MRALFTTRKFGLKQGKTIIALFSVVLMLVLHLGTSGFSLQNALALTSFNSFNTDVKDYNTLRSSNYTQYPDSTDHWNSDTNANPGDTVSLAVYYHNSIDDVAKNTRVSMFMPSATGTDIVASAKLWADNYTEVDGQTTIHLSSSQSLVYIPGSAKWYPNQSLTPTPFPNGQSGDEVITANGVNIGNIDSGWATQGSVVARFKVSQDINNPDNGVSTLDVTANGSQGPYTLSDGESFTVDWISSSVTDCTMYLDGEALTGVEQNGSLGPIDSAHPYYPAVDSSKTFKVTCTGLGGLISDSVVVSRGSTTTPPVDNQSSIDVTVNGSQGPYTLSDGEAFTVDWISQNVTDCTMLLNGNELSGVEQNGSAGPIDPAHPYYPAEGSQNTFTVTCTGLTGPVSDSVVVIRPEVVPPPAPLTPPTLTAVTSTDCGGVIDLSWNAVTNATYYKVIRDSQVVATTTATTYKDTGLNPGQDYSYTVRALNSTQESADSSMIATAASASCGGGGGGNQVSQLDVTVNGSQGPYTLSDGESFTVDWISENVTDCTLSLNSNVLSGVDQNGSVGPIDPAHPYYPTEGSQNTFTVTCTGVSAPISDSVVVIRPVAPHAPVAPNISSISTSCDGSVTLQWDSVSGATSYKVFRDGTQIANTSDTTYVDQGLAANSFHSYTVKAVNNVGDSENSNVASITVPSTCAVPPQAPTIVASTSTSCGGKVLVYWNSVENATSYKVYRNGNLITTTGDVSFTDTGLTSGQSYSYKVVAHNDAGDSVDSNTSVAIASSQCVVPPEAPVLGAHTSLTCGGKVDLSWNLVSGASEYSIIRNGNVIATTTSTTYIDSGLTPGQSYSYAVKAKNSAGESASSNLISAIASNECPLPSIGVTLTANPGTISQGQNSTLTWTSMNATSCSAPWTSATSTAGNQVVSPQSTTSYLITCTDGSRTATSSAIVTVTTTPPGDNNVSVSLTANPGTISQGQNSTLSWTSQNATSCNAPWTSATSTSGSQVVSPLSTTSYSITCQNATKSASSTATVIVNTGGGGGGDNDVIVSLNAVPDTIFSGATSTLSWVSTYATSCASAWSTSTATFGSALVNPTSTTVYSITCQNATKSATATTTVTVLPNIVCYLPTFTGSFNVTGKVGDPFTYTFTASSSATSTLNFTVGTSTLPTGLSYSNGVISGTPTQFGTFSVPFSMNDECGTVFDLVLTITINPAGGGGGGGGTTVTANLTANPMAIKSGQTSTLAWTSENATSCSAPWTTATSTAGSMVVSPTSTTEYIITCTNGTQNASSNVTVTIVVPGGGSGGSRSGGNINQTPVVLGEAASCEYLKDYLHIGWDNNPAEVIKLQVFLKELEGFNNLQVTSIFDQQTFDAVSTFQVRYQPDILTPWGYAQGESTGYVYILTKKKINEIFCQKAFPLTNGQENEIAQFRAFLEALRSQGITLPGISDNTGNGHTTGPLASSTIGIGGPILSNPTESTGSENEGGGLISSERIRNAAAAIFAGPQSLNDALSALGVFLLALLAIYYGARTLARKRSAKKSLNENERRSWQTMLFIVGILLAILISLLFSYFVIILPLLILLIISAAILLWLTPKEAVTDSAQSTVVKEDPISQIETDIEKEFPTIFGRKKNVEPIEEGMSIDIPLLDPGEKETKVEMSDEPLDRFDE